MLFQENTPLLIILFSVYMPIIRSISVSLSGCPENQRL
jgi:hypothetical protein